MRVARLSWVGLILLTLVSNSSGQSTQGGMVGTISDEKGAEISGAKVRVTNVGTGLQRETTTSGNGLYRLLALPTGTYEVTAEAQGFATTTTTGIEVGVDQIRTLDLALRVSAIAETVTVPPNPDLTQPYNNTLRHITANP